MKEIKVDDKAAGKRLDRFLKRCLPGANDGLIYSQIRKKNITLNGVRARPGDIVAAGDSIQFFFSEDTWRKFANPALYRSDEGVAAHTRHCYLTFKNKVGVIYEDGNLIIADKPAGLLTQSARTGDDCLNDWLVGYLLEKGELTQEGLAFFRPSACHRLDRNTSGLVACAKTAAAARELSDLFKMRLADKYYSALVHGEIKECFTARDTLKKNGAVNKTERSIDGAIAVCEITPVKYIKRDDITLLNLKLITGKPHQLRIQLALRDHPIVGDIKYGGAQVSSDREKYGTEHQLLHCEKLVFPALSGALSGASEKTFTCKAPFVRKFFSV